MRAWFESIENSAAVERLLASLPSAVAQGAAGSSTTLLAAALRRRSGRPVLLVVAHLDEADDAVEDLDFLRGTMRVARFGALEVLPGESAVSLELLAERLELVSQVAAGEKTGEGPDVIVAPIAALMQAVPEPEAVGEFALVIARGDRLPPARLLDWLERAGYTRTDAVEQPGDYAPRGGIVDLFPPTGEGPVRLDFLGDEVESIHLIDTQTMGSGRAMERLQLIGATASRLATEDRMTNLLSLLPRETLCVLGELMELREQARGYYERLTDPRNIYAPAALFRALTQRPHVRVNHYTPAQPDEGSVTLPVSPLPALEQDAARAVEQLIDLSRGEAGGRVVVLCQNPAERDRLSELLKEQGSERPARVELTLHYLHRGFVWRGDDGVDLTLIPHHELFHRYHTRRRVRRVGTQTAQTSDAFLDLDVGDYVVHTDHGIARFVGMKTMRRNERTEDYLTLAFAHEALLHVPASQIDLVSRYVGGFAGKPPLSLLGGKRWAKQKLEAQEAAKEMAAELLRVQAARASLPGVRYPEDTAWQKQFEAQFPYDETDDQLAAIATVKRDMADEQPMDRLICGDVGFGKTEIAVRAAFKAVEFGKQVAVLVPTTVLAEQHGETFRARMADYPFRINVLNRFKSPPEVKQTLQELERGQVDIVIGTHRLLSEDVKFADLGLVVIDEEQRFGVEHKHKLLRFRMTADVLTLSATPIPRTLHMAMLGLRDISSLTEAPRDRRAIVTEVCAYDRRRVQQAIRRELNREGQVFFVHNRVHDIHEVAHGVQGLVPEARVIVGHGQMAGHELEEVMLRFFRGEADVLVCTTIIESGIDVPRANTIFIHDADQYGLSDLHQLRGRVGRYKHRAYCYLLLPEGRVITETARRRLAALEQYAMLGAGFKIAMRDLEIRGAGNLLGAQQSGHIAAVGYEMYCKLLEQEAARLRREPTREPSRCHLELPMSGRLPASYIASDKRRMDAYKRLSRAGTFEAFDAVVQDLTQAFGPPPEAAQVLLDLAELRVALGQLTVNALKLDGQDLIFRVDEPMRLDPLLRKAKGRTTLVDDQTVYHRPPPNYLDQPATLLALLRKLLVSPLRSPRGA